MSTYQQKVLRSSPAVCRPDRRHARSDDEHRASNDAMASLAPSTSAQIADPAAGPYNLAVQAQYVGLLALLEDKVVHCSRNGGGVALRRV